MKNDLDILLHNKVIYEQDKYMNIPVHTGKTQNNYQIYIYIYTEINVIIVFLH